MVVANSNVVTRHISFADLNLASASGESTLNRRVGGAIVGLCKEAIGGLDGTFMTTIVDRKCRKSAWNQAGPQIALAVQRSREIASTGTSPIAGVAITIVLPH
jgi:UrcA family protein